MSNVDIMDFNLLGPLEVVDGDRIIPIRVPRHRAVLAVLALEGGRPVSLELLQEALTGGREITTGVIKVYVSDLRKILPRDLIETVPAGYRLRVEPDRVDVWRFRDLADRRDEDPVTRIRTLEQALELWRGPALADVDSDHLRRMEAAALEEQRAAVEEELCDVRIGLGHHRECVVRLRNLARRYPLREHVHLLLMVALYRSGNLGEALSHYHRVRQVLAEELGAEPSAELRRVHERMLREDPALDAEEVRTPAELPPDDRSFVGRRDLLSGLSAAIARSPAHGPHPIVLYGHAGVGKSTLAVHAAWRHRARFPGGQLFADLRRQPDAAGTLARFLRAFGYPGGSIPATVEERTAVYRTLTADRRLLVLLDNATDEEQVRPLMPTGPGSLAIITSRSALAGLAGAEPFEVDVFTAAESRELLERMAGRARAEVDGEATASVLDACAGLPIAVRAAAARLAASRDRSARGLARRLRDEAARLDEFRAGDTGVRPLLSLAYEGLDPRPQALLARLTAITAPSFAAWVAEPLAGGPAALDGIADCGLLQRLACDDAGQDRFRVHELTQLMARERLPPEDAAPALSRLARVALARVRAAVLPLTSEGFGASPGPEAVSMGTTKIRDSIEWLDAELGFLTALVADLHGLPGHAWRLAHALTPFLEVRHQQDEWRTVNRHALAAARADGDPLGAALVLRDRGDQQRAERDLAGAIETYQSSLGQLIRYGDAVERARVLFRLGVARLDQSRLEQAERSLAQGRAEFRGCGDRRGEAACVRALGVVRHRAGDQETALACLLSALRSARDLGDRYGQAACLHGLVSVRLARGEVSAARQHAEEERDLAERRLRDPRLTANALLSIAVVLAAQGDPEAGEHAGEAARRLRALGDRYGHAWALTTIGDITGRADELDLAYSMFNELGDQYGLAETSRKLKRS
ncbi:BTAD domain-containing putative transcriptional regulator [Acrocarpospora macrocephala]